MKDDEKLADEILHQSLSLFRLSAAQVKNTIRRLRAMEKRLIAELSTEVLTDLRRSQVEKILKKSENIVRDYYGGIQQEFDFEGIGTAVATRSAGALEIALGSAAMPTANYLKSLASTVLIQGSPAAAWWCGQSADTTRRFSAQVRQGLASGETNQEIISRIVGKSGAPGVMEISRRNAAALVQTSVQAVANDARLATFRANADVVKGLRQISTLDSHTSEICIAYSGAEWDLEGNPIGNSPAFNGGPPRHFNCRSALVPITKTFKELGVDIPEPEDGTRASSDGQISRKTSFEQFLKRKGEDYQNEMLGEGRANLWREGKITLRDLVDGKGRPLTLAQLVKRFS